MKTVDEKADIIDVNSSENNASAAVQNINKIVINNISQFENTEKETLWPSDWTFEQWQAKQGKYVWMCCYNGKIGCSTCQEVGNIINLKSHGVEISPEWSLILVSGGTSSNKKTRLAVFRNKIKKHVTSSAHKFATEILIKRKADTLKTQFENSTFKNHLSTTAVFRTAYYISKNNKPFNDHYSLLELQKINGLSIGITLHSRFSSTSIISHISMQMKEKIVNNIIKSNSKISVLIDESTTLSTKSTMVVFIKSSISSEDPIFIFLDLVELRHQTAENIANQLIECLHKSGFSDTYLKNNWIYFVSDGASTLLGKKFGVAKRLKDMFPLIFNWHCLNHRLELAVNDTMKDLTAINHFKLFIDSLYVLYNNSPKNKNELKDACCELDIMFVKIGRVLDVRWVASSWRLSVPSGKHFLLYVNIFMILPLI